MELITNNINSNALLLSQSGYTKLQDTEKKIDTLFVNHKNKSFWFTSKETAEWTLGLAKLKSA